MAREKLYLTAAILVTVEAYEPGKDKYSQRFLFESDSAAAKARRELAKKYPTYEFKIGSAVMPTKSKEFKENFGRDYM